MELDITTFFRTAAPMDYSASAAELGQDAGRITWTHAVEDADEYPILDTEDKRQAFREDLQGYGAWDEEEIEAWTDQELTALLMQMISGDIRESCLDTDEPDWKEYEEGVESGTYSGRLYRGDDGRIYYYIGD